MSDGFDADDAAAQAQREAVVEVANLTNGMTGGMFDRGRGSSRILGLSRPHSTAIWRVRVTSAIAALALALMAIASPVILGLTVGVNWGVTVGLWIAAVAAFIVFAASYAAERREIIRRAGREQARP